MNTEEKLKNYIVQKYGSLRKFAPLTGLPYSTIASILRRGVKNCNGQNLQAICDALNISSSALLDGVIEESPKADLTIFVEKSDVGLYLDHFVDEMLATVEPTSKKEFVFEGSKLNKRDITFMKHYINMMMNALREERKSNEAEE